MRLQILSDLHLETECFHPAPAPDADALILAGDIDASWAGLDQFRDWPVPVVLVAGNHEFDQRDLDEGLADLRSKADSLGITLLEKQCCVLQDPQGRRIRFCGTVRWSDFDLFGPSQREKALRAGAYFMRVMKSSRGGQPFDAAAVREEALACREWLAGVLGERAISGEWDATVVITHFAPSLRSADPRYGRQPGTASFCNADDDLLSRADLWIHGHLHCRQDYLVDRPGRLPTRVVCQARGLEKKGETAGYDPLRTWEV